MPSLLDLMGSPLFKSFAYNPKPHDRREALPLLLAVLAAWEEHIVSPACAPAVGLLLGALLLCAHCSLRFGDIQRIKPSALSLSAQALRGLCWARTAIRMLALRFSRGRHQHVLAGEVACPAQPSIRRHSGRMGFVPDFACQIYLSRKHWCASAGQYSCPGGQKAASW